LPFNDPNSQLFDIQQSILDIQEFVAGMDLRAYQQDAKTQAAVERKLLIISEAAIRLTRSDIETQCPEIPWRDVRGIGNWLRHQYDRVSTETVWNTIQDDLPPLKAAVEALLGDYPSTGST
jgi:uncharacterized protein with HEPN domain